MTAYLDDPYDIGARIVRGSLRRARVFRDRQNPLAYPDDVLHERYRFSAEGLRYLCQLIEADITNVTRRSQAFTTAQTVCLSLRYFASGQYMYSIGDAEHLSKNTVCRAIRKVVLALAKLVDAFVVFPGHLTALQIKEGFYAIAGFPRVIGVIDCTHIPISASLGEHEGDFVNRKSQHTINVQMTCDHQYMVTSLDARWPGSVHDARIFRESLLSQGFQEGRFDGLLLGDRGYPCQKHLMTPFADPQSKAQRTFNHAHSVTRVRMENTFGILKARFSCLKGLRVKPARACQTIAACVVLHNIATIRKERVPVHNPLPPDVTDPMTLDHPTGRAVRDAIAEQFFN
ncbi:putative nuclease HARBI1 [Corythoichthys intestinalis]|uniref:putative nuclease HARBI1 n=1 Tax=Corythoichthys intestinalis TaxID=161448 RepID=UPI0025A5A80A|nr:putative nuclease HARBI1 [Corythoichthys intestinalis]